MFVVVAYDPAKSGKVGGVGLEMVADDDKVGTCGEGGGHLGGSADAAADYKG